MMSKYGIENLDPALEQFLDNLAPAPEVSDWSWSVPVEPEPRPKVRVKNKPVPYLRLVPALKRPYQLDLPF
jgi:hypothetical protein